MIIFFDLDEIFKFVKSLHFLTPCHVFWLAYV